jgi:lysophospholipase L1-like esterase
MGMRYVIGIGALLLVGLGAWVVFGGTDEVTNYPPKNTTIVAFGDSLVYGQGSTKGNDFVSALASRIGRPIVNLGVPGNTTADGVARMKEVEKRDPGLVLLLLGGNDTLRRVDVPTTEANLRTLITTFQNKGAVVMFIGVRGGILGSEREDMYERVADEYGAIYVPDILDGILLRPELMHDGIHPNDAGYAKIAERLHRVFKEYEL